MIEQAEKMTYEMSVEVPAEATRYMKLAVEEQWHRQRGEVNPARIRTTDPATLTRMVKETARDLGADLVGVAEVDQAFVYKGRYVTHKYAISLGAEMDYGRIATSPSRESRIESCRLYCTLGETTTRLAEYIRGLGFDAHSQHPMGGGDVLLVPFAVAAGLGEHGRNGLLISREFGPCLRLGCVTTDIPLLLDKPVDLGVSWYCQICDVCRKACPGAAIPESPSRVRGIEKYTIDWPSCFHYFEQLSACSICIKECILNKLAHSGKWLKVD